MKLSLAKAASVGCIPRPIAGNDHARTARNRSPHAFRILGDAGRARLDRLQRPSQHGLLQCAVRPRGRRGLRAAGPRPGLRGSQPALDLHRRGACALSARAAFRRSGAGDIPTARPRRQTAALFRRAASRRGELALGHLREHGAAHRYGCQEDGGLSNAQRRPPRAYESAARHVADPGWRRTAHRHAGRTVTGPAMVTIREHKIPSADSKPYIAVEGPDRWLWFCESGAAKIGRLDPDRGTFTEFALLDKNATPIGITTGGDGNLWFAEKSANKIGRVTPHGEITEFALPTPNAGPDGIMLGPDGNVWFSESEVSRIGRITPDGRISEFADGITPGAKPLSISVRDGALWFSEAAGNRIGHMTVDGKVTEFPIPSHDSQPRATVTHPDGSIWFVETSTNALGRIDRSGRITEHAVPTPNASLRGVTVGADGDLWYTANFANKIGRMAPDGTVRGEFDIPTPNSGARCIAPLTDGRLFFTQYDAGLIGEVVVR